MGRAVANRFAGEGPLLLADRNPASLDAVKGDLGARTEATCTPVDVTDPTAVKALAAQAGDGFRNLVVTAGLSPTMGEATDIVNVNIVGMARVLEAFEPLAGEGSVAVCFASIAGHGPLDPAVAKVLAEPLAPDFMDRLAEVSPMATTEPGAAYGTSKAGVISLVGRSAAAWGARGARILSLSPGIIDTPMGAQEMEHQPVMADMIKQTPLGRQGRPEEIAEVVYFLCSPLASYMTGCDILVDGGFQGWSNAMAAQMAGG